MNSTDAEIAAWAREQQASFEIAPLIEMHGGQKLQVGYEVNLFVELPVGTPPGPERQQAVALLWQRLRDVAERLLPAEASKARLEIAPFRAAARLRPENEMEPEVMLTARLFHASDYFTAVDEAERVAVTVLEKRLTSMGLKQGHW